VEGISLVQTQKDAQTGRLICKIIRQITKEGQLKTIVSSGSVKAVLFHQKCDN